MISLYRLFLLCLATIAGSTAFGQGGDVSWSKHGKSLRTTSLKDLSAIAPPQVIKVQEPHAATPIEFEAIPMRDLLAAIYGKNWMTQEELVVRCVDGYQPSLPLALLRNYEGYLAFRRADQKEFSVVHTEKKKTIELGPYYLVWKMSDRGHPTDGGVWPYQIAAFDVVRFADKFPKLAPKSNASAQVRKGFELFRHHCLHCHALDGEGGKLGPELAKPVNVTSYFKEPYLSWWIINPAQVRHGSTMPAYVTGNPKEAANEVSAIVAYLKTR